MLLFTPWVTMLAVSHTPPPVPSEQFHFTVQSGTDAGPNQDIAHAGFPAVCNSNGMKCNIDVSVSIAPQTIYIHTIVMTAPIVSPIIRFCARTYVDVKTCACARRADVKMNAALTIFIC